MNALLKIDDELPPYPEVHEIQVDSAMHTIERFKTYIGKKSSNDLLGYEFKAIQTLPIFEAVLIKLIDWKGDMIALPNADELICSVSSFITDIDLILGVIKESHHDYSSN